jgi:hypothetical protein
MPPRRQGEVVHNILDHAALIDDHPFPDNDVEWSLSGRKSGATEAKSSEWGKIRRCPECSAVHKWSAKCPECSYIYQIKDRTIEEIYGELRQIMQGAKYESQRRFARRCKLSTSAIRNYVKRKELVTYGPRRLIKIKEGLARVEWLVKYETKSDFAKRVGATPQTIHVLLKRGLPIAANGRICIEDGLEWLKREGLLTKDGKYIRKNQLPMPGFDNQRDFAKRLGADVGTIANLIKKGLPINELRLIPIDPAMQWLRREGLLTKDGEFNNSKPPRSMLGFDTRPSFAKRLGADVDTINRLIDEGLPINERRLIPVEGGLQWLRHKGRITKGGKYISRRWITDEQIKQVMVMRRQGCTWGTIGELLGVNGKSMSHAIKRRGIKLPDNDVLPPF